MIRRMVWMGGVVLLAVSGVSQADEAPVATIGPSGDTVDLSHRVGDQTVVDHLPLHRSGDIRYFSAGVGMDERAAKYPPFSLKLVFTAGGKPFLTGVSVTIKPAKGRAAITIPAEEVDGPWLFVDLPPGVYDLTAVHRDREQGVKGIKIDAGKRKEVQIRWPEDRGLAKALPAE